MNFRSTYEVIYSTRGSSTFSHIYRSERSSIKHYLGYSIQNQICIPNPQYLKQFSSISQEKNMKYSHKCHKSPECGYLSYAKVPIPLYDTKIESNFELNFCGKRFVEAK